MICAKLVILYVLSAKSCSAVSSPLFSSFRYKTTTLLGSSSAIYPSLRIESSLSGVSPSPFLIMSTLMLIGKKANSILPCPSIRYGRLLLIVLVVFQIDSSVNEPFLSNTSSIDATTVGLLNVE